MGRLLRTLRACSPVYRKTYYVNYQGASLPWYTPSLTYTGREHGTKGTIQHTPGECYASALEMVIGLGNGYWFGWCNCWIERHTETSTAAVVLQGIVGTFCVVGFTLLVAGFRAVGGVRVRGSWNREGWDTSPWRVGRGTVRVGFRAVGGEQSE